MEGHHPNPQVAVQPHACDDAQAVEGVGPPHHRLGAVVAASSLRDGAEAQVAHPPRRLLKLAGAAPSAVVELGGVVDLAMVLGAVLAVVVLVVAVEARVVVAAEARVAPISPGESRGR